MSWQPSRNGPLKGVLLTEHDSVGFGEFERLAPYIERWELLEAEAKAQKEERSKQEADAVAAAEAEAEKARLAAKPLKDAYNLLGSTDHEIIKAMERKLAAEGVLPADLVERRAAARQVVRARRVG